MLAAFVAALAVALLLIGCGDEDGNEDQQLSAAQAAVARTAEAYYDAFRERRLDDGCALVAERLLEQRLVVGANVAGDDRPDLDEVASPARDGCRAVHQRRRGWTEPLPREAWQVDGVWLDRSLTRARVDTSGEGSYWMRRGAHCWQIVGFGALTEAGLREFGGEWVRDPAGT